MTGAIFVLAALAKCITGNGSDRLFNGFGTVLNYIGFFSKWFISSCLCSLQRLLDASLPVDIEEGVGNDSETYSIGAALDHIGTTMLIPFISCEFSTMFSVVQHTLH